MNTPIEATYSVTLRFQFPAWDERDGLIYFLQASSKSKAIKHARFQARNDGHIPAVGKGRVSFKAIQVD